MRNTFRYRWELCFQVIFVSAVSLPLAFSSRRGLVVLLATVSVFPLLMTVAQPQGARANIRVGRQRRMAMPAKNYASSRYSSLDQITTSNAANLKVAWTFSTGVLRGHEAAPVVVKNTMYVVTPFPNILFALDLRPGLIAFRDRA